MRADAAIIPISIAPEVLHHLIAPVLVGLSGGMDSSVLLHRLRQEPRLAGRLRAIHIHHGLHPHADAWEQHCIHMCNAWQIPLTCVHVNIHQDSGQGLEAAARRARYAAFADAMAPDTIVTLAHHLDDQAETVLLRMLRGSGVDGLAAMRQWRPFACGWLWRPLLGVSRPRIAAYARVHALAWIDDTSNANTRHERNFLRHDILPRLAARWPHTATQLAKLAELQAQALRLLTTEDDAILAQCQNHGKADTLNVVHLRQFPPERRARVVRRWLEQLQLPALPGHALARIERTLLVESIDGTAHFCWNTAQLTRWRDALHAGRQSPPFALNGTWNPHTPLPLPDGRILQIVAECPVSEYLIWHVHPRRGGERIVLPGRSHSHALKHVLQHTAIPPWQRPHLPLLSDVDGHLLAAGDRILSARLHSWLHAHKAHLVLHGPDHD